MQDQFKLMYEAIDNISCDKKKGEKMEQELILLKKLKAQHSEEITQQKNYIADLLLQRDGFRDDAKDMFDAQVILNKKTTIDYAAYKAKISKLEDRTRYLGTELDKMLDKVL